MIRIEKFYAHNELRNFSYLLFEDTTGEAWVIDPYDASPFVDYIRRNSLSLQGILNTHGHHDHIRGNRPLQESFHCPVKKLSNHEKVPLNQEFFIEGLDTPGHTLDHQVFLLNRDTGPVALFSGDTLFNAGVGNCKNGGDVNKLYETTRDIILNLPPEIMLYPGHDYVEKNLKFAFSLEPNNSEIQELLKQVEQTPAERREFLTLAKERKINPFMRLGSPEIKASLNDKANSLENRAADERRLFQYLRSLRDTW